MSRTDDGDDRLAKLGVRVATAEDIDGLTATLTAAFANDPVWSWAFPDQRGLAAWWRLLIGSALRHRWVWTIDDYAAAAVWIPPGCVELTEDEGAQVKPMLQELRRSPGWRGPRPCRALRRDPSGRGRRTTISACSARIPAIAAGVLAWRCSRTT